MEKLSSTDKNMLRAQFKKRRAQIPIEDRATMDASIVTAVKVLPEVLEAKTAFVYLSRNGEASTIELVQALLEAGKVVLTPSPDIKALPHDGLFRVRREGTGHSTPYHCTESRIEQVDVIVVPGIVWDRDGFRIGFGGGYFDRLLAMARPDCDRVGLAYSCQLTDQVPREPWDEPVDVLITEQETVRTNRRQT